jgi:hypothetical protein
MILLQETPSILLFIFPTSLLHYHERTVIRSIKIMSFIDNVPS